MRYYSGLLFDLIFLIIAINAAGWFMAVILLIEVSR